MPGGLAAGQLVDERYALEEQLGEESWGVRWRAYDRGLDRDVDLREIEVSPSERQEALAAARTAIRVDHPKAVGVWDAFLDGDRLVVVTEPVGPGAQTLAERVGRKGGLAPKRVAAIGLDLLDALVAAHAHGIVHGAITPQSVLVAERAEGGRLTGFGLTPAGAAGDTAADLRALGAVLQFAVEGVGAHDKEGARRTPVRAGKLQPVLDELLDASEGRPDVDAVRAGLASVAAVPRRSRRRGGRPEEVPGEEHEEHDWTGAVLGSAEPGSAGSTWEDWSPPDPSDVWLPGGVPEAEPGDEDEPAAPAAPAASDSDPGADPDLAAVIPFPTPDPTADTRTDPEPRPIPGEVVEEEEPVRYRSTPSWPPPEGRRSMGVVILCSLVIVVLIALLITNGNLFGAGDESDRAGSGQARPVLATEPESVPKDWVAFRHPKVEFGMSYPPGWQLREEGQIVTVRDPVSNTELRVDYRKPPGEDPEKTWLDLERSFQAQHPRDYRRLQLSPATYLGHVAALWEFTYVEGTTQVHAVDLGFLTKEYRFALYFQAPAATWDSMLPTFRAFLSSVKAPK